MKNQEALKLEGLMRIAGMPYGDGKIYGNGILAYEAVCEESTAPGTGPVDITVQNLSCRFDLRDFYKKDNGVMLRVSGKIISTPRLGIKVDGLWMPAQSTVTKFNAEPLYISYEHIAELVKYVAEQEIPFKEAYTGIVKEGIIARIKRALISA